MKTMAKILEVDSIDKIFDACDIERKTIQNELKEREAEKSALLDESFNILIQIENMTLKLKEYLNHIQLNKFNSKQLQSDPAGELDMDLKRNTIIVKNKIKLIGRNLVKQGIEMKQRNDNDKLVMKIELCKVDEMLGINTMMYDNCLNKLDSNDIREMYDILQIDSNMETEKFLSNGYIRYKSIDTTIVRIHVTAVGNSVAGVSNYDFNLCNLSDCLTRRADLITDGKSNINLRSTVITITTNEILIGGNSVCTYNVYVVCII